MALGHRGMGRREPGACGRGAQHARACGGSVLGASGRVRGKRMQQA